MTIPGVQVPVTELNWILGSMASADACLVAQLLDLEASGQGEGPWYDELKQYAEEIRTASEMLESRLREFLIGQQPSDPFTDLADGDLSQGR